LAWLSKLLLWFPFRHFSSTFLANSFLPIKRFGSHTVPISVTGYGFVNVGKRSRIQLWTLMKEIYSAIECIFNVGASFYTRQEQRKWCNTRNRVLTRINRVRCAATQQYSAFEGTYM
jgi:hypothetical protein